MKVRLKAKNLKLEKLKKMNKISKMIVFICILLFFVFSGQLPLQNVTAQGLEETSVPLGQHTIKIFAAGKEVFLLADGKTRIRFGFPSVPDVIFGEHYGVNNVHNINYLPIRKKIEFYNNGYFFQIKNSKCNEEEYGSDLLGDTRVTDCSLSVHSKMDESLYKPVEAFSRSFSINVGYDNVITNSTKDILIYLLIPRLTIYNRPQEFLSGAPTIKVGNMTSFSQTTPWDIQLAVTGPGFDVDMDTFRYLAEEIWNEESKELNIGPLNVKTEIIDRSTLKLHFSERNLKLLAYNIVHML